MIITIGKKTVKGNDSETIFLPMIEGARELRSVMVWNTLFIVAFTKHGEPPGATLFPRLARRVLPLEILSNRNEVGHH